ncbi:MAG: hypothetical protein LW823_09835 [Rickettsiales bacterium]|jgi:hypothetical protein|nr:hypothetical protein [Rickettsiales bacterium]
MTGIQKFGSGGNIQPSSATVKRVANEGADQPRVTRSEEDFARHLNDIFDPKKPATKEVLLMRAAATDLALAILEKRQQTYSSIGEDYDLGQQTIDLLEEIAGPVLQGRTIARTMGGDFTIASMGQTSDRALMQKLSAFGIESNITTNGSEHRVSLVVGSAQPKFRDKLFTAAAKVRAGDNSGADQPLSRTAQEEKKIIADEYWRGVPSAGIQR